jgi:Uma2 family endonuclease
MAIAHEVVSAPPLTYEQYLAEGEINQRYDILDGERIYMSSPNERHQDILGNIFEGFRAFQRSTRAGKAVMAPRDVLITRTPLRTRQPDVLFISHARRAQSPPATDPAPLSPAPELIVEIISSSERDSVLQQKLADYAAVDVLEGWIVYPTPQTVEVRLQSNGIWTTFATYGQGEIVASVVFPGLSLAVADIFAE